MTLHRERTHPVPVEGCFACKISGIQFSPQATSAHDWEWHLKRPPKAMVPHNSWEKGVPSDSRNMPFLRPGSVEPHSQKSFVEQRHTIEEGRRKALTGGTN